MSQSTPVVDETTVETEEAPQEDFPELDDFDWLLADDEAVDSSLDPDEPLEEVEQAEDEDALSDDLYTLRVGGADKQVSREEVIALAQQGDDYTRKTQEVAAQREALQPLADLAQNLDANPEATIRWLSQQYGVDLSIDPEIEDPRDRRIRQMESQVQQLDQKAALEAAKREIQADLNRLQVTHGEFDREALVQFAAESRIPDLDKAYLAWIGQQSLLDKAAASKRETLAKAHKDRSVVELEPSRREKASVTGRSGKISVREAFMAAAQEAGIKTRRR